MNRPLIVCFLLQVVNGSVVRFPVDDHQPPTLAQMLAFCEDVDGFLEMHPENVAAVHCKVGGVLIASIER